jgi:dTDP-4-amino-4,6-dideoxygalactose transaminase
LKGTCADKVIKFFEKEFGDYQGFTFNYARSGMYVLFKSLRLQDYDEVLVQGYTCIAAVNPIIWSGGKVVYVDIDRKTGNMDSGDLKLKISEKTKVVLFQHTYGNSEGVEEVAEICRQEGLILIEDCTNTILGKNGDKMIGSYGEASIFSFGRDKAVSGVDGGIILVRKDSERRFVRELMKEYENLSYPRLKWVFLELLYPLIWFLIKITFTIKVGKVIHFAATKLHILHRATSSKEKEGFRETGIPSLLPNSLACLAVEQLEDLGEINEHRKHLSNVYEKGLKEIEQLWGFEIGEGNVLLRYPILVNDRDGLVEFLIRNNVYVGDWYTTPIAPVEVDMGAVGYRKGLCPSSESICNRILNLPTHINVSEGDAQRIVDLIKEYYGN